MSEELKQEDELIIDTSKMSREKQASMEVAEAARESEWTHKSFARELFMGNFDPSSVEPFPAQSPEDKAEGDAYIEKVSKYLDENLDPEEVDETRTIPQKVIDDLAEMGVFAMKVPKKYDGLGFTQVNYNRVMMMISSHCGSTAVLISAHQSIGVPQPLKMFGTEEQKKKFLPRFRTGSISAFALTEEDVGSDPAQMTTEAILSEDGKNYVLNGTKLWTTNGPIADILVVMAKTQPKIRNGREIPQITAFVVEKSIPGIETIHRCDFMGIRGIQNGVMTFKDVLVPAENIILGEGKGLKLALATLNTGRLTLPAACTGMAKSCLTMARVWGNERKQWGLPIGFHEAGREKISRIARNTFAMEAVTWITSHWADQGNVDIRIEAAMAKLFCSELAWEIIDDTMQLRGGRGYEKASSLKARGEKPYPIERMMRECRINRIIEGTSEIMKLFLAREAMDPHLRLAADLLKKHSPTGKKIKTGIKLATYYATWYPSQWINSSLWSEYEGMGQLSNHFHTVDVTSHKLARTIFHYMGLYQDKLERKQNLLGRLMEIGTELFAITATCSFAKQTSKNLGGDNTPIQLADAFCRHSIQKINRLFDSLSHNEDECDNRLAKSVLKGKMTWLEDGVKNFDD